LNTRLVAARVLARVFEGLSLTVALDAVLPDLVLAKDRAFVQALTFGVLRQFYKLDFILAQLLDKPIKDPEIKALALSGLYQLAFMRVKSHAAVSETVTAARKKAWAKPLLNGLLRNFQRHQERLLGSCQSDACAANSHPNWLIHRIRQDWPGQASQILAENNRQAPMVLRVNKRRTDRGHYLQLLADQGVGAEAGQFSPASIVLENPVPVEKLPAFADGWVSVQDGAAQLAAGLLAAAPGQRVLDVCAAPGGKTAHILETQPLLQELVAVDVDPQRIRRVDDNLQRLGLHATVLVGDAANPQSWWDGRAFDGILLDAPCSATGVIRRHPDIKLLRKPADIDLLQAAQKKILEAVWPLLAPGGRLLYATCSVLKQENECQIAGFLATHADAKELPVLADWGDARPHGRQILTGEGDMDGFYYALLKKI